MAPPGQWSLGGAFDLGIDAAVPEVIGDAAGTADGQASEHNLQNQQQ